MILPCHVGVIGEVVLTIIENSCANTLAVISRNSNQNNSLNNRKIHTYGVNYRLEAGPVQPVDHQSRPLLGDSTTQGSVPGRVYPCKRGAIKTWKYKFVWKNVGAKSNLNERDHCFCSLSVKPHVFKICDPTEVSTWFMTFTFSWNSHDLFCKNFLQI